MGGCVWGGGGGPYGENEVRLFTGAVTVCSQGYSIDQKRTGETDKGRAGH